MKTKKVFTRIAVCVLIAALALTFSACNQTESSSSDPTPTPDPTPDTNANSGQQSAETEWLSPMLSVSIAESEASVFSGTLPVEVSTNDFGSENRGKLVTALPEEGQPFETAELAQLTAEGLLAAGAVKLTANFAYEGGDEYNVRFRFRVDRFVGHSITQYGSGAADGIMILWQDADGVWWNIRRTGLGGQFTGGELTPGYFNADGSVYNCYTLTINRDTASNFASRDFYVIVLDEDDHDHGHDDHDHGHDDHDHEEEEAHGFVITYQAELPDHDGHFHNFAVLSSATAYITVTHAE